MNLAGANAPPSSACSAGGERRPVRRERMAGLILAGGASSRMGTAKALLPFPGPGEPETFLDRLIGLLAAHCSPVIVVLGHQAETIRAGLRRAASAVFVVNANYERGQLSSLQCGLRAVPEDAGGVLFTPVDYPGVAPETVAKLAEAFRHCAAPLVVPRWQGRRGHPVCCARELLAEFLALPPESQAREVIHRHASETCYVDVDDPGILHDVDDPEAYRRLVQGAPPQ